MSLLPHPKPLIGVVHLPPLPGAPRYEGNFQSLVDAAVRDAHALAEAGFDAVLVENFGDAPFFAEQVPAETIAAMAVIADAARRASSLPLGVNVLRNDGASAMAIAVATQARFIRINVLVGARVTDQGVVSSDAARVLRLRSALHAQGVGLIADVGVKHSTPLAQGLSIEDEAIEARERSMADVLVVSGTRTGQPAELARVHAVKNATHAPVWLGSGVKKETLRTWLQAADGVIVGSDLRQNGVAGGPIDPKRAQDFVTSRDAR